MDDEPDGWEEPREFRTQAEADDLFPLARAVVDKIMSRLPPGQFDIDPSRLFVARQTPEEVACYAAALSGVPFHRAPVSFQIVEHIDETVDSIVDAPLRWRRSAESEANHT